MAIDAEVKELMEQSKEFDGRLVLDCCEEIVELRVTTKLFGELFREGLERIWTWLVKDNVSNIGIYGMGGVGKTTLVKHIHNRILGETDFSVYWVTVSQDFSIKKLQNDIVKLVEIDLSDEDDEERRASMLSRVLMKGSLIILDDVWEEFSLENVGIPSEPTKCRLILTTRSLEVCHRMRCERTFEVKCLESDEAWHLLEHKLGMVEAVLHADVAEIAKSITKRCAGLPLGIVTVAGSMRGNGDIRELRSSLECLKDCSTAYDDMEQKVFPILAWSYSRLNELERHCFLYCCLYPEDHHIPREELIVLFVLAELIPKGNSRESEFDHAHKVLNKLIKVCLLEETKNRNGHECVKIHDLIREMALRLTKGNSIGGFMGINVPKFLVKRGEGRSHKVILEEDEWTEDLNAVSFILNYDHLEIPPGMSPNCPNLSTMLFCNAKIERFPDLFFRHMDGLKVLNLQWFKNLKELPDCISDLVNLTALLLRGCKALKSVPPLGKLKQLRELNLSDTGINAVPQGLEELLKLERLYMLSTRLNNKIMPKGTLSKLHHLQHLESSVQISDPEVLKRLQVFRGHLAFLGMYTQFIASQCWPKHYAMVVAGRPCRYVEDRLLQSNDVNRLVFNGCDFQRGLDLAPPIENGRISNCVLLPVKRPSKPRKPKTFNKEETLDLALMPEDIGELTLNKCFGLSDIFFQHLFNTSKDLSKLVINHSEEVEFLLNSRSPPDHDPLQNLQVLMLNDFPNLVSLINWSSSSSSEEAAHLTRHIQQMTTDPPGTFSSLTELYISRCPRLKKLFPKRLLQQSLQNLEKLVVEDCDQLEEIATIDHGQGSGEENMFQLTSSRTTTSEVGLPKLQVLCLERLPLLEHLGFAICDCMVRIWIHDCPKVKRLPLLLPIDGSSGQPSPPKTLKVIRGSEKWWKSLEWDNPNAKHALQPFFQGSFVARFDPFATNRCSKTPWNPKLNWQHQ